MASMITDRPGLVSTMEAADFIYGVTMEEAGSSHVVSLKLGKETYEDKKTEITTS